MTLATLTPLVAPKKKYSGWDVLDTLPTLIASVDARCVVVETNLAWEEFGLPNVGDTILSAWKGEATEPLVRSTLHLGIGELVSGARERFEIEYPLRCEGDTIWLALSAYRRDGGAVVTQTDITERRRAETRSAQESATAHIDHALVRAGQDLITTLDLPETLDRLGRLTTELLDCDTSHTIFWQEGDDSYVAAASHGEKAEDAEAIRHMRLPRTAFVGGVARGEHVDVSHVVFDDEAAAPLGALARRLGVARLLQISLRHGDRRIGFQTACRRRDEPFTEVEERLAARLGQLGSLAIENARLAGQLGETARLKSEFVATVSHELRTPIHVVLGFADLLLEGEFGALSSRQRDAMKRVLSGARTLLEISDATLQLNRLDDGQVGLQLADVDLPALLEEVEAEVRTAQREAKVPVERCLPPGLHHVHADRQKLKLILKNLLSNGLKFTERGSVRMSAETRGRDLVLVVEDTGIGIETAVLPTIFEAFRQADGSAARRYGGIGLGLHIVRRVAERLGGAVRAQSTLGEGSRFEVSIPIEPR